MPLASSSADELEEYEVSHEKSEEGKEDDKEDEDTVSLIVVALLLLLCAETPGSHIQLILSSGWRYHCCLVGKHLP